MSEALEKIFPGIGSGPLAGVGVIAGPCSAESRGQMLETAYALRAASVTHFRAGLWKPRTKPGGFEGVGETGISWLAEVRDRTGMRTATEVATPAHVEAVLKGGLDFVWIGARTVANPFAMQELAEVLGKEASQLPVLVKNPVSPDLELWIGGIERLRNAGVKNIGAIHRGFPGYAPGPYRNEPHWRIPFELRRRMPDLPVICDPSHIGGRRDLIEPLSQQALDMGFDGLIIESHCHPEVALSDSAQQVTPRCLGEILKKLKVRPRNDAGGSELEELRAEIDRCDAELIAILGRRLEVCRRVGNYKKENGMAVVQPERYQALMSSRVAEGVEAGLDSEFMKRILTAIHEESVRQQLK